MVVVQSSLLVEIWMVKAVLMRSWTEMRNMLLDNREKLHYVFVLEFSWQIELGSHDIEGISGPSVEGMAWLLTTCRIRLKPFALMEFAIFDFLFIWDLSLLSSFLFCPFGMGMSFVCLSHHCILAAYKVFGFTSSQLERNVISG